MNWAVLDCLGRNGSFRGLKLKALSFFDKWLDNNSVDFVFPALCEIAAYINTLLDLTRYDTGMTMTATRTCF
jgi:hypothetical protein